MKDKLLKKKWLITPKKALTATKREKYWVSSHRNKAYGDVFSITEDEACRARIMTALNEVGKVASVLVPGCGSRTFLQETLVQCHAIRKICCTDFAGVVQIAKQHFMHPKVQYLARNSTKLGFENEWDAVVVINSVLSESDKENRLMPNGWDNYTCLDVNFIPKQISFKKLEKGLFSIYKAIYNRENYLNKINF